MYRNHYVGIHCSCSRFSCRQKSNQQFSTLRLFQNYSNLADSFQKVYWNYQNCPHRIGKSPFINWFSLQFTRFIWQYNAKILLVNCLQKAFFLFILPPRNWISRLTSLPMHLEAFTYGFRAMRWLQNKFTEVLKWVQRSCDYWKTCGRLKTGEKVMWLSFMTEINRV